MHPYVFKMRRLKMNKFFGLKANSGSFAVRGKANEKINGHVMEYIKYTNFFTVTELFGSLSLDYK
jgi:hypothetical protein